MRVSFLLLFLAACSGVAAVTAEDGGDPEADLGVGVDGGTPEVDLGTPDVDAGPSCGTCGDGFTCLTANGIPVCRSAQGIPAFGHVIVIVMENTSQATLLASTNTPMLHSLFGAYASSADYHGVAHPSLPNYLAMVSGQDVASIDCDCQPTGAACSFINCSTVLSGCGCPQSVMHIGDQLEAAGMTWRNYAEDMGTPCNVTAGGDYAPKHVPFLYYTDVQSDTMRCRDHVVDYGAFAADLGDELPTYALIAPNLTHDMHGSLLTPRATNLANGDAWLSTEVPPIVASRAYTDGGLLVIVWDEDDGSGVPAADDPIPMLLLSPYAKNGGYVDHSHADHASLLATIEDGLGLPRLGAAASATPLADFFPAD